MTTGAITGSEVVLQSEAARTCEGYVELGLPQPVRILVRSGATAAGASAGQLVEALDRAFSGLGVKLPTGPLCRVSLRPNCLARNEEQTLNLLVWVGDGTPPGSAEEAYVSDWLASGPQAAAVAVVPEGAPAYEAVPEALAASQVIWWSGDAERAALDVVGIAAPDSGERRVFVSYSHQDGVELAHEVHAVLTRARFSVFLDSFDLDPAVDFAERIEHELVEKAFLVLIETPGALRSRYVIDQELGFARMHRLGVASVRPASSAAPPLPGFAGWRWNLPPGKAGGGGLDRAATADLERFLLARHAAAISRRRWALEAGLRAALHRRGVRRAAVSSFPGGLRIDAAPTPAYVSLRPRPAALTDMHAAFRQTPGGARGLMVSATPRGVAERGALSWLGRESTIPHHDEGRLLTLARELSEGRT